METASGCISDGVVSRSKRKRSMVSSVEWNIADFKRLFQKGNPRPISTFEMKGCIWSLKVEELVYPFAENPFMTVILVRHSPVEEKNDSFNVEFTVVADNATFGGYTQTCSRTDDGEYSFPVEIEKVEFLWRHAGDDPKVVCSFYSDVEEDTTHTSAENTIDEGRDILCSDMKDLLLKQEHCDFVIKVKDKEFHVHKPILSARSPVLAAMVTHDMSEKNSESAIIDDSDPDSLERFLLYLYSGQVEELAWDNAMHLYILGDKYDLPHLKSECLRYMVDNLTVDVFCDATALAVKHSEPALVKCAERFFLKNAGSILPTTNWQLLLKEQPVICNELFIKYVKVSCSDKTI